jgi:primosomal protein N'
VKVVSVLFSNSQNRYDYLDPVGAKVGDVVVVPTRRGDAEVVVAEVKESSDRATVEILRIVENPF